MALWKMVKNPRPIQAAPTQTLFKLIGSVLLHVVAGHGAYPIQCMLLLAGQPMMKRPAAKKNDPTIKGIKRASGTILLLLAIMRLR